MFPITPPQRIAHLRFMVEWWSGRVLVWVNDPQKLAAVQAELAAAGG